MKRYALPIFGCLLVITAAVMLDVFGMSLFWTSASLFFIGLFCVIAWLVSSGYEA